MVRYLSEGATSSGHVRRLFTTPELSQNNSGELVLLISQERQRFYRSRVFAGAAIVNGP